MSGLALDLAVPRRDFRVDVALRLAPGARVAVTGPSGAGKTTLLRALAGLEPEARGRIACGGEVWLDDSAGIRIPAERRRCGFVFQDHALFPHLSALDNVAYPLPGRRRDRRGRALALLERLGMEGLAGARPGALSGGERQRVALARALAREPSLLLLDEPLASLDQGARARARGEIARALDAAQVPAIVVTHDFSDAAALAGEVVVMDRGEVVQRGAPDALAARPASAFVAGLTGATTLTGTAAPGPSGLTVVAIDGGGTAVSADDVRGRVAVSVFPWEIALEPAGRESPGSPRNRVDAEVASVTLIGNRARVGLATPQPVAAEITAAAAEELGLAPGVRVSATWKATATRVVPLG